MKTNVGSIDRVVRIVIGLAIIVLGLTLKSWWGLIGILPLLSAICGFCALYSLIGVNTCGVKKQV